LNPSTILLADRIGPRFEEAYYEGAEAIFVKPVAMEELAKGVAYTFDSELIQAKRQHRRKKIQRARVAYAHSDGLSISAYGTNISAGGMFVATMDDLPTSGQEISFRLQFETLKEELTGSAIVRWVRSKIDAGRPRGFGCEFKGLEPDTITKLKAVLEVEK
jgi:Tfp pilus assembly protein PilZ